MNTNTPPPAKTFTLNLVEVTREEVEASRSDAHRMALPEDYKTNEDLKWFRDEKNAKKFVKKYWGKE